ncbi:hypothetical protein [Halomonas sp.]|uniref:hypothetical protein n=1 Tax=Halomonas sp. TaxID=1486246 RepID=UPI00384C692D
MAKQKSRKRRSQAVQRSDKAPKLPQSSAVQTSADFADRVMCQRLHQIEHIGANAYLLALAAWQRGLKVTFHYTFTHSERFAHLPLTGYRGEFLTISDGRKTHDFYRVMGDLTTRRASALAESKPHTKAVLAKADIDVAEGVVVEPGQQQLVERFLAEREGRRFLMKPVNGTLGRGVLRNLTAKTVLDQLASFQQPMLLEEFVVGTEYRVYVTDDRVISAMIRRPACVQGDGQHSVEQLVESKAAARRAHPVYRDDPIVLDGEALAFLAVHGHTPDEVPAAGTRVYLSDVPSQHAGGDMVDASDYLPEAVRDIAVRAARALGLPHAGLDLIVTSPPDDEGAARDGDGQDGGMKGSTSIRTVVLEANQNPYIRLSSIPMPGVFENASNRITESIIDHYFPRSVHWPRLVRASFDFPAICQMLQSGVVGEVSLPVLGRDWVHERFTLPATQVDQGLVDRIHQARLRYGVHAQLLRSETGDVTVDAVAPKAQWEAMRQALASVLAPLLR